MTTSTPNLRDKPEDLGFPPVEPTAPPVKKAEGSGAKPAGGEPSLWDSLLNNVLKNPFIWGMALTYFFIYVVRQASVRGGEGSRGH